MAPSADFDRTDPGAWPNRDPLRLTLVAGVMIMVIVSRAIAWLQDPTLVTDLTSAPETVRVALPDGRDLYVGTSEVTVADWSVCVEAGACPAPKGFHTRSQDLPMTEVNWLDTQSYLFWLQQQTGQEWRLPTQREWLVLAAERAPVARPPLFDDPRLAWAADYDLTATPRSVLPRKTGSFGYNSHGLADLTGNVWEWTSTCWSEGTGASETCRGVRIAMGEHQAALSELASNPAKSGCSAGVPPSAVGFRIVRTAQR